MTQPRPVDAPTEQELLDAESLAYELAAEQQVTAQYAAEIAAAIATIVAAIVALRAAGGLAALTGAALESFRSLVVRELRRPAPDMTDRIATWIGRGVRLGARQAARQAPAAGVADALRELRAPDDPALPNLAARLDIRAEAAQDEALQLARTLDLRDETNVTTVLAKANYAVERARADVRWLANRAVNAGPAALADSLGMHLVWVAERDACLHCLAYSGLTVIPGQDFPAELTFADKPIKGEPIPYPPRHPNCRCRVRMVVPRSAAVPDALKREAQRSVARGWSAFASEPARLRAADRLVRRAAGQRLPKTVIARARRDVARRRFSQRHAARTTLRA